MSKRSGGARLLLAFGLCLSLTAPALRAEEAVMFGTFDPPHNGHVQAALAARRKLGVETIHLVPNRAPADKPDATAYLHRLAMLRAVARDTEGIEVLDRELVREAIRESPVNWVRQVFRRLYRRRPAGRPIYHVMGSDSFMKLVRKEALPAPGEPRVVTVVPRKGHESDLEQQAKAGEFGGKVRVLDVDVPEVSSSEVRRRHLEGRPIRHLVPSPVLSYLKERAFYEGVD